MPCSRLTKQTDRDVACPIRQEKNTNQIVDAIRNLCNSEEKYKLFVENSYKLATNEYDLVKNSKNKLAEMDW